MKQYGLDKRHKLCSVSDIDRLFAQGAGTQSAIAYPLRVVWAVDVCRRPGDEPFKILVSVPKKRLRKAVDRVAMRRRMREAYRLNRRTYEPDNRECGLNPKDIAFIYVADRQRSFATVEAAMKKLLSLIHSTANTENPQSSLQS